MKLCLPIFLASLLVAAAPAPAAEHQHHHAAETPSRPGCGRDDTRLDCALVASPAFLTDGSLVLTWAAGGRVMFARSPDHGLHFLPAVAVNDGSEAVDTSGDARPAVAADSRGRVYVAWSVRRDNAYNGTLRLARSLDGGVTFAKPREVASDHASQRFATVKVDGRDRLYLAWIDKREAVAAKAEGRDYRGAALAMAWSDDGAATFAFEQVVQPHSCECCRIAFEFDGKGRPLVMWRHVFDPNIRDHAIMVFADRDHAGQIRKVSEDNWRVDACPHAGPAMAVAGDGSVTAAWYSGGGVRKGVFFARAPGPEASFSDPIRLGRPGVLVSQPQVLAAGGRLWMAWKEFDGQASAIVVQRSDDQGRSWSSPWLVAQTGGASDRPLLVGDASRAFLSWVTQAEGWHLTELPQP